jgi:hypothetical protein
VAPNTEGLIFMNYEEQVRAMLRHATQKCSNDQEAAAEMGEVVKALGNGIAIVAMGLPQHIIGSFVVEVSRAIASQIREYQINHGAAVTAETFLRDVFKPEKFHG